MEDAAPKADGFNLDEIKRHLAKSEKASMPQSIRKRGYHRALKRGEFWAHSKQAMRNMAASFERALLGIK